MNETEMMQRLAALESEVKALKSQKFENMKQAAVDAIYRKYPNLDERYEMIMDYACHRVQVSETDTQFDVTSRIEEELKQACRKAQIDEPSDTTADIQRWFSKHQKQASDDQKFAEELAKHVAK